MMSIERIIKQRGDLLQENIKMRLVAQRYWDSLDRMSSDIGINVYQEYKASEAEFKDVFGIKDGRDEV